MILLSQAIDHYVKQNEERFLEELKDFIRIPSVSTRPEHEADVRRATLYVAESMRSAGLENIEIIPTERRQLVYANWLHAPGRPTVTSSRIS